MLLAYAYPFGPASDRPELCLLPAKPDQFSVPVRVFTLIETKCAVLRLSPTEGITVQMDRSDGGCIITPVVPSKLYLTPSQPDRPGIIVKSVKVIPREDGSATTYYLDEGRSAGSWKEWAPNDSIPT
jgi:hypothetical protein